VLQNIMGWDDIHLHRFFIHGKDYGIVRPGGMSFADDPWQVGVDATYVPKVSLLESVPWQVFKASSGTNCVNLALYLSGTGRTTVVGVVRAPKKSNIRFMVISSTSFLPAGTTCPLGIDIFPSFLEI